MLLHAIAQQTGFKPGTFGHTIVDAHVYCGKNERGDWYGDHLGELQSQLAAVDSRSEYRDVKEWLLEAAPDERDAEEEYDHVPGLLEQLSREPRSRPTIDVADVPVDELSYDDFTLDEYDPAEGISFSVAE